MKQIKIKNGELRIGYEFKDLSEEATTKVLTDQATFVIETMDENSPYYAAYLEMQKMQTPWFLLETLFHDYKQQLIDDINVNEYLFDEEGELLNITRYIGKNNELIKTTYGKKEYECEIIDL